MTGSQIAFPARLRAMRAHLEDQPMTHADSQDLKTLSEAAAYIETVEAERDDAAAAATDAMAANNRAVDRAEAAEAKVAELEAAAAERAKENEACAKVAETYLEKWRVAGGFHQYAAAAKIIRRAIRSRMGGE